MTHDVEGQMRAFIKKSSVALFLCLFATILFAAGDKYFVQSKVAKLYQSKSFSSSVLSTLKQGDQVQVLKRGENWAQVKVGKLTGWVPVLLISDQRPVSHNSVLIEKHDAIKQNARRRASSTSVAGAARGLQGDDSDKPESLKTDYPALQKVEKSSPSEKQVEQFMREGKK
jgi:hypothetical protein